MAKGYIYIMTNQALGNDIVKIGYAKNVENRRKQLSTTALPFEYEVYATYETSGNLEDKKLHKLIDNLNPDLRVAKNREFFIMTPEDAYELLEAIAIISGSKDKLRRKRPKKEDSSRKTRKPPVDFYKCNIPNGAELVFIDDPTVVCTVESNRKVLYHDELTSLSAIAKAIKGFPVAGPSCFTYQGKLVADIARETQWKDNR